MISNQTKMLYIFIFLILQLFSAITANENDIKNEAKFLAKIDINLLKSLRQNPRQRSDIILSFRNGDTSGILQNIANSFHTNISRSERAFAVYSELNMFSKNSQENILNFLSIQNDDENSNDGFTSYWISNQIFVRKANSQLINALSRMREIESIEENSRFYAMVEKNEDFQVRQNGVNVWGVEKISAPSVWLPEEGGFLGQGIIVGVVDTGARYTHRALRQNYVGTTNFGWLDAINGRTGFPYDDHGHGSHTTGIAVGRGGIGVAPRAQWMHCKGLNQQSYSVEDSLMRCLQWMNCPNPLQRCSRIPHVINNSWGGGATDYRRMINSLRTSGIIPVFSAGNYGNGCGTIVNPGSNYQVITVGNTDENDKLATSSSCGPVSDRFRKPDISAPGRNINSAGHQSDNQYQIKSGTSMAVPHVVGTIALFLNKNKNLKYDQIKNILEQSAVREGLGINNRTCGTTRDSDFPNNFFGWGRIDTLEGIHMI